MFLSKFGMKLHKFIFDLFFSFFKICEQGISFNLKSQKSERKILIEFIKKPMKKTTFYHKKTCCLNVETYKKKRNH